MADQRRTPGGTLLVQAIWALVGVAVLGLGSAVLRVGGVGLDPFTAANVGLSDKLGVSLGVLQLCANIVLLVPLLVWGRRQLGLGTIINAVLTGWFVQVFSAALQPHVSTASLSPLEHTIFFVIGILLFAAGASLYMSAGIGASPYDALAPTIVDHTGWQYRLVRTVQDLFFVAMALLFHGPVGIGTVMTAFFAGGLIQWFNEHLSEPLVSRYKTSHPQPADGSGDGSTTSSAGA